MSLSSQIENTLFIINCQANEHRAPKTWKRIEYDLEKYGVHHDSVFTTNHNEGVNVVRKDRYHRNIISVSGDGGVNSMTEGAMKNDYSEKRLGTIPVSGIIGAIMYFFLKLIN